MSESCSHNCSGCQTGGCSERTAPPKASCAPGSSIKHVIGVVSGKGGVGKSFTTALIASQLARDGYAVGVLDGDITGASIPRMFGVTEGLQGAEGLINPSCAPSGIKIVSTNLMVPQEDTPFAWRGPVISGAINQFFSQVAWGDLDYLLIDMPPGTSDVFLTVLQSLPVDGLVMVAAPQDLVSMIVGKAVNLAHDIGVPIVAYVENMAYFTCDTCQSKHYIFGESRADQISLHYGIPAWTSLPLNPSFALMCDQGCVEDINLRTELSCVIDQITESL